MSEALPARPNLDWLKKTAKQRLVLLRAQSPDAKLADAQRDVAREYGFGSWKKLKAHVEEVSARESAPATLTPEQIVAAFLQFVGTGEIEKVGAMLKAAPQLVNAVGPHPFWGGRPQALHVAIETKRREIVALLLENGADVNGKNDEYDLWSPLMLSVNAEDPAMREELLRRGARVGLLEALMFGDDARVKELLSDGKLPDIAPNRGSILALAKTTFAIDRLIELGAPTTTKDRWGSTPIDAMSRMGKAGQPLVRHMLSRGIVAKPAEYARLGDRATLETMMKSERASVVGSDDVIKGAVDFSHYELVEWLLSLGANVNARSNAQSRETCLHSAAWNGDLRMVKILLAAGADRTIRDEQYNGTVMDWALTGIEVTNNPKCQEVVDYLKSIGVA